MRFGGIGRRFALAMVSIVALGAMPGSVFADGNAAPVVTASVTPVSAGERQPVIASATFTDADSTDGFTCQIDYGDGGLFATGTISGNTCTGPGHLYKTTGSFVVLVFVTDNLGATGFGMASVSNYNYPPDFPSGILLFGSTPQSRPEVGRTSVIALPFRDMGSALFGDPIETYTCTVNYGDGTGPQAGTYIPMWSYFSYPTCLGPDHVYQTAGTYTISGTVIDSGYASGSTSRQVTVAPPSSLVMTAPADQNITSLMAAQYLFGNYPYSLGSFVDPNGAGAGPWSYVVEWGDGGGATGRTTSQGALTVNHFYLAGSYRGHLTVTDAAGWSGDAYFNVTMASDILLSMGEGHGYATEGVSEPFELFCFDPNVYAQTFDIHLDWGDGSTQDIYGASNPLPLNLAHTYVAGGGTIYRGFGSGYTLIATVTDSLGHQKTWSSLVGVQSLAPVIAAPPVKVAAGDTGLVTIASFTDLSVGPYSVAVTFPNGYIYQPANPTPGPIQIPAPALSTGSYQIQVYDHTGMQSTVTVTVQVGDPTPLLYDPTWSTNSGVEGWASSLSVSFSDSGNSGGTYTCSVDYGDGAGAQAATISGTRCVGPDHYYTIPGTHAATISVTASNGAVGTLQTTLIVSNTPPSISSFTLPSLAATGEVVNASAVFGDPGMVLGETYGCWIDFGDGSGNQTGSVAGTACNLPAHIYSQAGTYVVTVGVADGHGLTDYATSSIQVVDRPLTVGPVTAPATANVGSPVTASANFTPTGRSETYTCTVDYGDGTGQTAGVVSGTNCTGPDHAYLVAGDMSITITVTGSVSGSASSKGSIHVVKPGIPVGAVSIPDPSWVRNFTSAWADFVPSQLAETYTCTVDYGDGNGARPSTISGSTCVGPWATYNNAGSYTVTIAVTGSISGTGLSTTPVTVAIPPKMDAIHAPASTIAGSAISASADFTPPPAFNPTYTCLVDYGDGTGQQAGTVTGHTCQGPSHTYTAWGTYSISVVIIVWIRPDASISIAGSQTISVSPATPIVGSVSAPASAVAGVPVSASASFTPTGRAETYTCTVDYGDGKGRLAGVLTGTSCKGPGHAYATTGSFTITVRVTGSVSGSGSATTSIDVTLPTIAVGALSVPASVKEGTTVTASASFTPTALSQTYKCTVDYGDGLGAKAGTVSGTTCKAAAHLYGRPGSFTVTVSVNGSAGSTGLSSKTVTVANVAPVFTKFSVTKAAKVGSTVTMSVTFTDPGSSESYRVFVIWGDGTSSTYFLGSAIRSTSATHVYTKASVYMVTLNIGDDADVTAASLEVGVFDPARTLTGSGTFASEAGFCQLTPKCNVASTGTYSVSARYANGATTPTLSLSISAKEFAFSTTTADWVVTVDGTSTIQGTATVNGKTGYRYYMVFTDGSPDSLSIGIMDPSGANVVYSPGLVQLKSGSIVIK